MSSRWTAGIGILLVVFGVLLFLSSAGLLAIDFWGLVFPLFLIGLGALTIWVAATRGTGVERSSVAVPLDGAQTGRVRLRYGGGRLIVGSGAAPGNLVEIDARGGAQASSRMEAATKVVDVRPPAQFIADAMSPWRWAGGEPPQWSVRLPTGLALDLEFETGASESRIDLSELRVGSLDLSTGASATRLTMPAQGRTEARIRAGAAEVKLHFPPGVAGRIRTQTGLGDVRVNPSRFPSVPGGFESPDFSNAVNRVDLTVEVGAASVDVD